MNESIKKEESKKYCFHMNPNSCVCNMTATGCPQHLNGHDCALYVPCGDAVPMSKLNPKLSMLIRDAGNGCLFVDKRDRRFTKRDLKDIEYEVVNKFPALHKFVRVNPDNADAVITIFGEGLQAARILVDK